MTPTPAQELWKGLQVAPENRCASYQSDDYHTSQRVKDVIIADHGGIYSPYTGEWFETKGQTDIEHIVPRSEAPGGRIGGLTFFEAAQADAVHRGLETEIHLDLGVMELEANASYVDIKLAGTAGYAPSIPPFGGRVQLHVPIRRLQIKPELRWAARMDRLNPGETPTDGYALLNLNAFWVFVGRHTTSTLSFHAFNLSDAEHRRHSALGKDLYLLMGRSFRIGYSLRFF